MSPDLQRELQQLLDDHVAQGEERGAQVSVYQDGREIANVVVGRTGGNEPKPITPDTLIPIFSTMKGILCTAVHILAERGQVDYDAPMTRYWPEYGANGKAATTVRHALSQQAGIPYVPDDLTPEQMGSWAEMSRIIANLKPAFPPGERQFYHAHTLSWLLGELIHRVDGRDYQSFVAAEIMKPLGVEFYAGLPDALNGRVATVEPPEGFGEGMAAPPRQNPAFTVPIHYWINKPQNRALCSPGVNGISNARSIALHYAALLPGGVDGIELLPPSRVKLMTELQTPTGGWPETENARKGLGYQLGHHVSEYGGDEQSFGHNGHGGSVGFASPRNKLAVGITRNRFSSRNIGNEVYDKLQSVLKLK